MEHALDQGFDTIFHIAALAGVWGDYDEYFSIHDTWTKNLLETAKAYDVSRFVHISFLRTVLGQGRHMGVGKEIPYPQTDLNAYGETKQKTEEIVLAANNNNAFLTCALRPHLEHSI